MNKPFNWYGGKAALAPLIVSLLPAHQVYCEVFGGSGAVLFAKRPGALEIFNDLDSGVTNFFRVLRHPEQASKLQQLLEMTPYAREEYYMCLKNWQGETDPVEKARQWYCSVMQSMNSTVRASGWSSTKEPGSNPARAWSHTIAQLSACSRRLAQVEIDHRDFAAVIQAYDSPQTCFYPDPPYLPETRRRAQCYWHELTQQDHERLLTQIQRVHGMVVLSGYAHPLYQEALASWECLTLRVRCSSVSEAISPTQRSRIECIWRNPACVLRQGTLFDQLGKQEALA
jgi:DNA adenine methylase